MSVQNTINTVQTIDLDETAGTLVIKGEDGATLYTSNELADGTEVEVVTEEAEEPTVPETPKDENEPVKTTETIENPKTNDSILLVLGTLAVSGVVAFVAKRKNQLLAGISSVVVGKAKLQPFLATRSMISRFRRLLSRRKSP